MNKIIIIATFFLLCLSGCDSPYTPLTENAYIADAENVNFKRLTVDDQGGKTSISLRMSSPASSDVYITLAYAPEVLEVYNKKNEVNYLPLPEHLCQMEQSRIKIPSGKLSAAPVDITVLPYDESVNESEKYAIPLKITSVEGASLLEASSELVILLDKVIITNILEYIGGATMSYEVQDGDTRTDNLTQWTVEFLIKCKGFGVNKHVLSFNDGNNPNTQQLFCRFGNLDHPTNEIQFRVSNGVPIYGNTLFTPNRWYHVAFVYDGTNLKLYVDGKLDLTVAHGIPGQAFSWKKFELRPGNPGSISEFRIWNKERKQGEIENNMYVVNPQSEGLITYWKFNEGEGTTIHDHSVNERHLLNVRGAWIPGQRFPENME